jgi:hypothetical protein
MHRNKIYLDTAIWYDLAEDRLHAPAFEAAVSSGQVIPVFSFIHLMEFALSKGNSYQKVIRYIEKLRRDNRCCWIRTLPVVAELELRQQILRSCGIKPQPFSVFTDTFVDTLNQTVRGLERAEARNYDMATIVSNLAGIEAFHGYQESRRTGALMDIFEPQFTRARSGLSTPPSRSEYFQAILADMPDNVTTDGGLILEITPQRKEEILQSLQWDQLPAISLRLALTNGWSQMGNHRKVSDFGDLFHIAPPLAYCDVTFTDRRAYAALEKGKAFKLPKRNGEFLTWSKGLSCPKAAIR